MRIIPKKIKVKNTVWKCYSMPDVIVALVMFALIFAFITTGNWVLAVIFGIVSVVMFMPTQDGIFYACILENVRFLFSKKKYTAGAKSAKESVDALIPLKDIKDNGLIEYMGGSFGRVIKVGQKNFGIEDEVQQNNRGRGAAEHRHRLLCECAETYRRQSERGHCEDRPPRESGRFCE